MDIEINEVQEIIKNLESSGELSIKEEKYLKVAKLCVQLAIENFRSAMESIGHIRRTMEETFGGLHGTHVEPDVLAECKAICDAIYAAYRQAQPVMFIDGDISSEDADKLAKVILEFNEEDERPLAKMARITRENPHPTNECDMPKAQPAPVSLTEAHVAALEEEERSFHDAIRKCIASLRYHHKRAEAHSAGYKGSTLEDDTLKSINFLKRNITAAMLNGGKP